MNRLRTVLGSLLLLLGPDCTSQRVVPAPKSSDFGNRVFATEHILFLPESTKNSVAFTGDSVFFERRNARDSVIVNLKGALADSMRGRADSLVAALAALPAGDQVREGVKDGAKIWIDYCGKKAFCDNCLSEYVLEAVGMPKSSKPRSMALVKDAVSRINAFVMELEKQDQQRQRLDAQAEARRLVSKNYGRTIVFPNDSLRRQ